ncbi:MAG: competence/damage-inducible protein A [candidate division Zixibacteria bacterium]|nr:competence/damage-inducible protein A [candidate division Zixibacteria bacterium]
MKAEIITIGDEIMYGQTVDTNSAYISQKLGEVGIEVIYQTSVGDDVTRIVDAINLARQRVELILTTGGLGPTHDDITLKGVVKAFQKNLIFHAEILEKIKKRYEERGIQMPQINQNQALIPQGAKYFDNQIGSAPGILIKDEKVTFISLPGIPAEMRYLIDQEIIPYLTSQIKTEKILHKHIRTTGIVESALYEKLEDIIKDSKGAKIAFLPGYQGVDLRLTALGKGDKADLTELEKVARKILSRIGEFVYSQDLQSLEEITGRLLRQKKQKLATAESCTGGLLAAKITNIPGASDYFDRGVVTYANQSKTQILGIDEKLLKQNGAVSPEVAEAMAVGVRKLSGADFGIGVTGIAGPSGGTKDKPVGLVYIGLATKNKTWVEKFQFGQNRLIIRERTAYAALNMLRQHLSGQKYV